MRNIIAISLLFFAAACLEVEPAELAPDAGSVKESPLDEEPVEKDIYDVLFYCTNHCVFQTTFDCYMHDENDVAECDEDCRAYGINLEPQCYGLYVNYISCVRHLPAPQYTCSLDGWPVPAVGCGTARNALSMCRLAF